MNQKRRSRLNLPAYFHETATATTGATTTEKITHSLLQTMRRRSNTS